ncbi:tlde1 domain-containing protein [Burkholderia sp. A9]|uniref:tlde1 domain-containing protein n=1 Tax=Burkholderia sp. A9 TaxID=1365108 RepID=UPI0009E00092|nr:tlde1 domain-containing protein [Burkholderia sp. A9]
MGTKYAAERGNPSVPACARASISLRFDGRFLVMTGGATRIYPAVSGRPDSRGNFDYSSARQQMENVGPIPPGRYWIQPSQMWTNRWYNLASRAAWGDHRLTIHVMPGTRTFGRGGFFIHGGSHAGSAGCINLNSRMEGFVRDIEAATKDTPECYVPLTVQY